MQDENSSNEQNQESGQSQTDQVSTTVTSASTDLNLVEELEKKAQQLFQETRDLEAPFLAKKSDLEAVLSSLNVLGSMFLDGKKPSFIARIESGTNKEGAD